MFSAEPPIPSDRYPVALSVSRLDTLVKVSLVMGGVYATLNVFKLLGWIK